MRECMEMSMILDKQTYCSIYERMERPSVTQSWAWGEAKAAAEKWDVVRVAFHQRDVPVGLCQILRKKYCGVPLVSRINRGPLFGLGLSDAEKLSILSNLRSRFRYMLGGVLFIAPGISRDESLMEALRNIGFVSLRTTGWHSSIIDLQRDTDQIRSRLHPWWHRQLKQSERSGLLLNVSLSRDLVELMIDKHEGHVRQKGFMGPSGSFVRALYEAGRGEVLVLTASAGAEPVGGLIIVKHGLNAECFVAWYGEEARRLNAAKFIMWNAITEMKNRGCRWLDLGGFSTSEGYGHFKIGMGGDEYDLAGEWLCCW